MTATEIVIRLQRVPELQWGGHRLYSPGYDDIVLRIGRHAGMSIYVRAKTPGKEVSQPVSLDLDFAEELGEPPQPYERLLADVLRGDPTLFPQMERDRGDVAHRAAPARLSAAGRALRAGDVGAGLLACARGRVRRLARAAVGSARLARLRSR